MDDYLFVRGFLGISVFLLGVSRVVSFFLGLVRGVPVFSRVG